MDSHIHRQLSGTWRTVCTQAFSDKACECHTVPVTVSIDGVVDHDICPVTASFCTTKQLTQAVKAGLAVAKGTQVWVKGAAGVGSVYLVVQYAGG